MNASTATRPARTPVLASKLSGVSCSDPQSLIIDFLNKTFITFLKPLVVFFVF